MATNDVTTVVAKGAQGQGARVATSRRLAPAAARDSDAWMRAMILARSTSRMSATVLGDQDMTLMRVYFVKPTAAIAMTFSDDPQVDLTYDRFSGSATARLTTTSFMTRTASLR